MLFNKISISHVTDNVVDPYQVLGLIAILAPGKECRNAYETIKTLIEYSIFPPIRSFWDKTKWETGIWHNQA